MIDKEEHPYNQLYSFESILNEVKGMIFPTILKEINPICSALIVTGVLNKEEYAEFIYEQVMILGYYKQDFDKTIDYLMPKRNKFIYKGTEEEDNFNIYCCLDLVMENFVIQVYAFEVFFKMIEDLKPHEEIIQNVQHILQPLQNKSYYKDLNDYLKKAWIQYQINLLGSKNEELEMANVQEMEDKLKGIICEINKPRQDF